MSINVTLSNIRSHENPIGGSTLVEACTQRDEMNL
jgi:hypothetical protein